MEPENTESSEASKPITQRRGTAVWVRDEQIDGLRRLAESDGESIAYHVRKAVAAYLKKQSKPSIEVRA